MNLTDFRIGLGCGVRNGIASDVLERGLRNGVRFFDTSSFYPVGAIQQFDSLLHQLGINRGVVHLSLKLWITELGKNRTNDGSSHGASLWSVYEAQRRKFNVSRFDSVVIHWPLQVDEEGIPDEFRIEEVWPQLEELVTLGCISYIGISNFSIIDLHRVLSVARIKPFLAQIEYNPFAHCFEYAQFCLKNDIKVVAHSPFNSGWRGGEVELFGHTVIKEIAIIYQCSPAQVIVAWLLSQGIVPVAGTTNVSHVDDIVAALDKIILTDAELQRISDLNNGAFNYLAIFEHFRSSFKTRYYKDISALHALIYGPDGIFEKVSILDVDFLSRVKYALTEGAGFIILPGFLERAARSLQETVSNSSLQSAGRWDGMGPSQKSVLNCGTDVLEIVDDPLLALIVESLLGWDCKLDNISLSTSRISPNNAVFGPHQDSPFDNNPGAPLPPPSYPLVLQCIVALDEFMEDNGPLYVIPHSHKARLRVNLPWGGNLPPGVVPHGAVKAIAPKGSVIVAVGHIWHGTYANVSASPRMGMLVEFVCSICDARDKFSVNTIVPELLRYCSRRIVRLLNNGKLHQHDSPGLLLAYKEERRRNIADFAKKKVDPVS